MKNCKVPMVLAILCVAVTATTAAEVSMDQEMWLGFVDTAMPREVAFEVPACKSLGDAAYLEMDVVGEGGAVISVWGSVNGQRRLLDCQCVGPVPRRIRLDIGRALSAEGIDSSVPLTLTTAPMSTSVAGAVNLRALAAGTAVRLVTVAVPTPPATQDVAGDALPAKRLVTGNEVETPAAPTLSVWPNPFNPQITISLVLPVAQAVSVEVYDLRGQKVRTLLPKSQLSPGQHDVTWLGDGDDGRPAASGVYLYVVKAGDARITGKMALLK